MNIVKKAPERYKDTEILPTYLETSNLTIYSHGPIGTRVFKDFFKQTGTRTTLGFVKPHHWAGLTSVYTSREHILVLRHPNDQHRHAAWLHGMSIHEVNVKRENMFYHTHIMPHLAVAQTAQFDFYIRYDKLAQYIFDYEQPATPTFDARLIGLEDELDAYYSILENKMELQVPQWRDLIMRGQLETI